MKKPKFFWTCFTSRLTQSAVFWFWPKRDQNQSKEPSIWLSRKETLVNPFSSVESGIENQSSGFLENRGLDHFDHDFISSLLVSAHHNVLHVLLQATDSKNKKMSWNCDIRPQQSLRTANDKSRTFESLDWGKWREELFQGACGTEWLSPDWHWGKEKRQKQYYPSGSNGFAKGGREIRRLRSHSAVPRHQIPQKGLDLSSLLRGIWRPWESEAADNLPSCVPSKLPEWLVQEKADLPLLQHWANPFKFANEAVLLPGHFPRRERLRPWNGPVESSKTKLKKTQRERRRQW